MTLRGAQRIFGSITTSLVAAVISVVASLAVGVAPAAAAPEPGSPPAYGQARDFAHVPLPGQPEGIAIDPTDGSVWTGSNRPNSSADVWHYDAAGRLLQTYSLIGHRPAEHGVNGITLDGDGRVYALDYSGARAVRIDPATGAQKVYATFADLPLCSAARGRPCEPGILDRQAWPNWATFAADGSMYVSDLNQATIWKVPAGGGAAQIWYQNPDFASIYSLNGMQFDARGRLVFVNTLSVSSLQTAGHGVVYRLPVTASGAPGRLDRVAVTGLGDGLVIGRSGKIYLPISNPLDNSVTVVDPDTGATLDALPPLPQRYLRSTPFSTPASAAFRGTSLIVTNHANFTPLPSLYELIEVGVGETGLPLNFPVGIT